MSLQTAGVDEIRTWAMRLPEVTEKQHHLFKTPKWQVRGRTFLGMGRDQTTAVFCIDEGSANTAAAADPAHAAAVRRSDARRSFLGLELKLAGVSANTVEAFVNEAWRSKAPRALVERQDSRGQ
jgi:hypothetical protein